MKYSNCLIEVIRLWYAHGGYVIMRRSKYGWWPHFMWSEDLKTYWVFVPPKRMRYKRRFPPLWYPGQLKERKL